MADGEPAGWLFLRSASVPEPWRSRAQPAFMVPLLPGEAQGLLASPCGEDSAPAAPAALGDELLRLTASGWTVARIARRLGVTTRTVDRRLARLRERYGVATTADLTRLLAGLGWGLSSSTTIDVAGEGLQPANERRCSP